MPLGILGGTLLATALKALFDTGSTIAGNKYNAPKAQLKRLRKAGLPLSYMYEGKVATQSETPKLSIDPTFGTLPQAQGKKLKADTLIAEETGDNLQKENQIKGLMSGIIQPDGTEWNNRGTKMLAERDQAVAEKFIKEHEAGLRKIELFVEQNAFDKGIPQQMKQEALNKASQMVKNLLAQEGLMGQLQKIRGFEEQMNDALTKDLESLPDWISSLLKIILIATKRR